MKNQISPGITKAGYDSNGYLWCFDNIYGKVFCFDDPTERKERGYHCSSLEEARQMLLDNIIP